MLEEKRNVYLIAGTLRPETMYGQTNCWIHPNINYQVFEMKNDDIIVCTQRCGNNLVYQELLKEEPKDYIDCKVVAIVKRKNDNEDKLIAIASSCNKTYTKEEMAKEVYFQEKFFDSIILTKEDL